MYSNATKLVSLCYSRPIYQIKVVCLKLCQSVEYIYQNPTPIVLCNISRSHPTKSPRQPRASNQLLFPIIFPPTHRHYLLLYDCPFTKVKRTTKRCLRPPYSKPPLSSLYPPFSCPHSEKKTSGHLVALGFKSWQHGGKMRRRDLGFVKMEDNRLSLWPIAALSNPLNLFNIDSVGTWRRIEIRICIFKQVMPPLTKAKAVFFPILLTDNPLLVRKVYVNGMGET